MSIKPILSITILVALQWSCVTNKYIEADFPEAMLPHVQEQYKMLYDQGQTLYMTHCGPCHNTKYKGKIIVPDFDEDQLTGYTLRSANDRHEANLPDTAVSEEELGIIMIFLKYKKRSGAEN